MAMQPLVLPGHIFNRALYDSLHDLWFSSTPANATAPSLDTLKKWFGRGASAAENEAFDGQCRAIAGPALESLGPDRWPLPPFESYEKTRQQADAIAEPLWDAAYEKNGDEEVKSLEKSYVARALILLLDQMTRNTLRSDQGKIYSHYDRIAYSLSFCITDSSKASSGLHGLDNEGADGQNPTKRLWFYLPREHAESMYDHEAFSKYLTQMKQEAVARDDQPALQYLGLTQTAEDKHTDIIEKFGRYPYRNAWLGRESTKLEKEWLESGGETFGARAPPGSTSIPPPVQITKSVSSGIPDWATAITSLTLGIGLGFLIAKRFKYS